MPLYKHELTIGENQKFIDITEQVQEDINNSKTKEGIVVIYCPHTTAGITINENADPDVCKDILYGYEKSFPTNDVNYKHYEGNSHAHMKSSLVGPSQTLIISKGDLILGTWQGVYFCEFDGPRKRKYYVKVISD